jgi:hypothetical protein
MILTEEQPTDQTGTHEWVPLTQAANNIGVKYSKLSRWTKNGRIQSRKNPFDERQTLVDMVELRQIFRHPE